MEDKGPLATAESALARLRERKEEENTLRAALEDNKRLQVIRRSAAASSPLDWLCTEFSAAIPSIYRRLGDANTAHLFRIFSYMNAALSQQSSTHPGELLSPH